MKRYIIEYEVGCGVEHDVVYAENEAEATAKAREQWLNEAADEMYEVKGEYTEKLARELDIWDED